MTSSEKHVRPGSYFACWKPTRCWMLLGFTQLLIDASSCRP